MRAQRRWTLMLVPDGCDSPRTITLSDRALRRLAGAASVLGLVALFGFGLGISRIATVARDATRGQIGLSPGMRTRLALLTDTIQAIQKRDEQIRLLAGLPLDSAVPLPGEQGGEPMVSAEAVAAHPDLDWLIHRANLLAASFAKVSDTLAQHVDKLSRIPSIMPTAGWLSSAFSRSRFHPILHISRPHEGIDVSAPMGAPIVAPAAGVVTLVTRQTGYGNVLEIDHGDGIVTKYAHCSRIVVRVGQHVKRGDVIANVGNTGLATGPHLHYEIHVHGKVVDPLTYVLPTGAIPD